MHTPNKTNMIMEKQAFGDVSSFNNGDFPLASFSHVSLLEGKTFHNSTRISLLTMLIRPTQPQNAIIPSESKDVSTLVHTNAPPGFS